MDGGGFERTHPRHPDFPRPGILFEDITTLLSHPKAYATAIGTRGNRYVGQATDLVVGVEGPGFIVGTALAGVVALLAGVWL